MVESVGSAVGISTLSVIVPEIKVFPVLAAILLFPVVDRLRNLLFLKSPWPILSGTQLKRNKFDIFSKWEAFDPPSATRVRKNRSAIRG